MIKKSLFAVIFLAILALGASMLSRQSLSKAEAQDATLYVENTLSASSTEINQLRYLIKLITGKSKWYMPPDINLNALSFEHNIDGTHKAGNIYKGLITEDPWIDVRAYGAVGDGVVDDTQALNNAFAEAVSQGKRAFIPPGTFKITSTLRTSAEIFGESPLKSVIYNAGTGDALDLGGASYYNLYENFQVMGNPNSRDGITLYTKPGDNPAYMQFNNVYSVYNGRHGLYHRNAWGTVYRGSKFSYNGGLGIYLHTTNGDPGTHNGVGFIQSESRWNGGTGNNTYNDLKGGVSINGAAVVYFIGCIVESNNAWQFLFGQDLYQSLQIVDIKDTYIEGRPPGAANIGGAFYIKRGNHINIESSEIGFGADSGAISYAFYVEPGAGTITERNNQYTGGGSGTMLYINSGGKLNRKREPVITEMMGDLGKSGNPTSNTLLTASNDGEYRISGTIFAGRDSEIGGVFPFIAAKHVLGRSASVGHAIIGNAAINPTIAWNGDNLEITFGSYHVGHVEFSYAASNMPTTFTLNNSYLRRNDELANMPF